MRVPPGIASAVLRLLLLRLLMRTGRGQRRASLARRPLVDRRDHAPRGLEGACHPAAQIGQVIAREIDAAVRFEQTLILVAPLRLRVLRPASAVVGHAVPGDREGVLEFAPGYCG